MPSWSALCLVSALALAVLAAPVDRASGALLRAAPGGDGDSWRDTRARAYRLGLVDAPELDECFGRQAAAERRRLTAHGFRAQVYATDRYGRRLSVVTLPDGRSLNVHLARQGFADDRYLERFGDERPELAAELAVAFRQAQRARRGLWGACG